MIRLLCVEDDPLVRTYLATRLGLETDIRVVGVVPSAGEALMFLDQEPVDVVLLDYRLEGADGLQLLSAIQGRGNGSGTGPRVLFCTGAADAEFDAAARERGAAGVVVKDQMAAQLLSAVRTVAEGRDWFPGGATGYGVPVDYGSLSGLPFTDSEGDSTRDSG